METIGSLIDKIIITSLKCYHMAEQTQLCGVNKTHAQECESKLETLFLQRKDLIGELNELFTAVMSGKKKNKPFYQFKMYNDPKYRQS